MFEQSTSTNQAYGPLGALRRFVRPPQAHTPKERCELCKALLPAEHQHLIEPDSRRLVCACEACAILFDRPSTAPYRRVPRRGRHLVNFLLADDLWDEFSLPINLAFFFFSTSANRILALYPSPAGPTESLLPLPAWETLVATNPVLATMQPDVEALLVNRLGARRGFDGEEYYLAPIDACYQLVGLIRLHWRGLGGGTEVWHEISQFLARLQGGCLRDESRPEAPLPALADSHAPGQGATDA